MAVHALMEVRVAPGRSREALRAGTRLGRRLAERPGFRGLRVFRCEADADALMVITEWDEWEAAGAAESDAPVAALLERVRGACAGCDRRRLAPLFHVQFPRRDTSAGMAQVLQVSVPQAVDAAARQKEFGLKAMTLPGTIGVLGGRCLQDPGFFFCAVEFDSDEALDDFTGSPARHEWNRLGPSTWWRKDPRLEVRANAPARCGAMERRAESLGSLSVRIESSPDGAAVILRLHGQMDEAAASRFVRVRDAVLARGCRHLTLDVSDLTAATTEGLNTLLTTARQVKQRGGQFALADNQGRFNHILRVLQLNRVLPQEGEGTHGPSPRRPQRRAAKLELPPGYA